MRLGLTRTKRCLYVSFQQPYRRRFIDLGIAGYSFFDSTEVELLGRRKKSPYSGIGKVIQLAEY